MAMVDRDGACYHLEMMLLEPGSCPPLFDFSAASEFGIFISK